MALPISTSPIYTLVIPSTKEEIKYRPFLVKEEKALLIAQQSEDEQIMIDTLKSIIESCVKSPIDVSRLAMFDIEYIFAQIRGKSVGEVVDLLFKCTECENENNKIKISFDLTKLNVDFPKDHTDTINIINDVGVKMKYPSLQTINKIKQLDSNDIEMSFNIIIDCIDFIYTNDQMFDSKSCSRKELVDFIENLTSEQFKRIQKFFETMPKIKQEINYTCPACGFKHTKVIEGISGFF